jgi:hypothetical protein
MPKSVNDMNDESKQLVLAAEAVLDGHSPAVTALAPDVVATVLKKLAALQRPGWEDGSEWPDPDDLELLADDITGGGE